MGADILLERDSDSKDKIYVLGTRIDKVTKECALRKIEGFFNDEQKNYIVTPNPEIILKANQDFRFKSVLNRSSLAISDGVGLQWAASYLKHGFALKKARYLNIFFALFSFIVSVLKFIFISSYKERVLSERVTGVDLFLGICQLCEQKNYSIFLLGAKEGIAKEVAVKIQKKYPNLKIAGARSGSPKKVDDQNVRDFINKSNPDVVFVAYGAPKQEMWIQRNLKHLTSTKIAMAVGGTFDFVAGKSFRAPKEYKEKKLEWLWRLKMEPWRKKRIFNAVIKFPYYVYLDKIYKHRPYRKNVLAVIINKEGKLLVLNNYYIASREKHGDHWQFLQGGKRPAESDEKAVLRESTEEMGSRKLEIIKKAPTGYQYYWPVNRINLRRPFKGQRQNIWFLRYLGDGKDIKLIPHEHSEYKWITKDQIFKTLHPLRHGSAKIIFRELLTDPELKEITK